MDPDYEWEQFREDDLWERPYERFDDERDDECDDYC